MKTNKNDELQSRREFFKSAAKAALPVRGAVVLSQLPITAQDTPAGCAQYGCGVCTNTCTGDCKGGCRYTCSGGCKNYGCKGVARA